MSNSVLATVKTVATGDIDKFEDWFFCLSWAYVWAGRPQGIGGSGRSRMRKRRRTFILRGGSSCNDKKISRMTSKHWRKHSRQRICANWQFKCCEDECWFRLCGFPSVERFLSKVRVDEIAFVNLTKVLIISLGEFEHLTLTKVSQRVSIFVMSRLWLQV